MKVNALGKAVICISTALWLHPHVLADTPATPTSSALVNSDNPEVLEIVELKGICEQCPDDKQEQFKSLHKSDRLRAMDDVRCLINSYAIGKYLSTKKTTKFIGLAWSPVGYPAPSDPSSDERERAGRVAQATYDNVEDARKAALASLDSTGESGGGTSLGAIFGGGKGVAIGAGVGAMVGGLTGYNWQAIHNKLSGATRGTGTQIAEQPDGSLKLNIPSSVTFDADSSAIKPSFTPVLDQLAQTLQQNPEVIAQVVGYTDSAGTPGYNQTLSVDRAQSVTGYLGQRGINPQRLSAQGVGQSNPVADNNTEAGRAANRRVVIYLRATSSHGD